MGRDGLRPVSYGMMPGDETVVDGMTNGTKMTSYGTGRLRDDGSVRSTVEDRTTGTR